MRQRRRFQSCDIGRAKARTELAGYSAMIENLDWNLGRLRQALKQQGLDRNNFEYAFEVLGECIEVDPANLDVHRMVLEVARRKAKMSDGKRSLFGTMSMPMMSKDPHKVFAGAVKRWHFHGADMTHGSMIHRKPQSGGATDAARTFKGVKRPGQMGNKSVTQRGLTVYRVEPERNLILIEGSVPGANGSLLMIRRQMVGG